MIYIASPYTYSGPLKELVGKQIEYHRYEMVEAYTAYLLTQEVAVYSPIAHCHHLAQKHKLPADAKFWEGYNKDMLKLATFMHIVDLPVNHDSVGIGIEINFAKENFIPHQWKSPSEILNHMEATTTEHFRHHMNESIRLLNLAEKYKHKD